ncbi:hypothetical protein WCLP8_3230004 [uncultured Gammaproteobacteria bacterium]
MTNAIERAADISRAENVARHHYLETAWKYSKDVLGSKGPYEESTTLADLRHAREVHEELTRASLLADRHQRDHH